MSLKEKLLNLKNEAIALICDVKSQEELEHYHHTYLARKGKLNQLLKQISPLKHEDKARLGQIYNETKQAITAAIKEQQKKLKIKTKKETWLDVTIPGDQPPTGYLHPISQAIEEISRIFADIGFTRVRHPEVDWDWYAFESLNMPPGHPARDEWETFFVEAPRHKKLGEMVLTPHTSNGQVREMERVGQPPIRMLNISKNYRRQQDITHIAMLHQFEGLVIDQGINIQHLKGTIEYFAHQFYGPDIDIRLRPFNFKFTEPSFEVDFLCTLCKGKGRLKNGQKCRLCKSGWLEVAGAGMVHPNVLKAGHINPRKYTGFAFGMGVERAYMLKPGYLIDDIRHLLTPNLDLLEKLS